MGLRSEIMFENIKWLFFDVGSTIVDEHLAYEHRIREIADLANTTYSSVYETAMKFYKQNKKGDLETAKLLGVKLTKWHNALERSNCKPNNAVMIGDRIDNDIIPAKLLGMHTIWIKQGFRQYWNITQEVEKADCVVYSLMEICNIL